MSRSSVPPVAEAPQPKRRNAGFWSSAKSFFLPVGGHIDPAGVRGYPIDLRVKADLARTTLPEWALQPTSLHVGLTQYALGCHERWLNGEGEEWLATSLMVGHHLLSTQAADGSWLHHRPFPHTFPVKAPWASGITQGQGASLFVRLHLLTGEERFAEAAQHALAPLLTPHADGGLRGTLEGNPWYEEYPTVPESHVLNGSIFALWGVRDVAVGLGWDRARDEYEIGLQSLLANLGRYDTGSWSLYSLFPHPIENRASSFYHDLHVNQLSAMQQFSPHPELEQTRRRWACYAQSRLLQMRAFAWKATFRLIVPRNPGLARRAPWTRMQAGSR
jgi:heparosan-N-sulfate-glucuronate 5-epimerase